MANSVANFIPEVWSLNLMTILDKMCTMAGLVNREYEGEIKSAGDTVHVRTFGDVTINTYTRNQTLSFQDLTDPMSDLVIDQQKYFAFKVDDLDKAQADVKILEGYTTRAAQAIKEVVDQHLHSHYADAPAASIIGSSTTPIALTGSTIYYFITQLSQKLDEGNCPTDGRQLVISPAFKTMLLNAPEFLRSTGLGDRIVESGKIGVIGNFDVHVSTNLNTANGNTPLLALTKDFVSFAQQVSKVEPVDPYDQFGKGVKGLYLYGSKVFTNTSSSKGPDKAGAVLWGQGV